MAQAQRVTIDQATTGKYQQAGISGQYNKKRFGKGRTRNVQVEEKYAQFNRETAANDTYYDKAEVTTLPTSRIDRRTKVDNQPRRQPATKTKAAKINLAKKKRGKKTAVDRVKASAVNTGIVSVALPSWLVLQFPFAILNIAFMGMAYIWESFKEDTKDGVAGFFFGALGFVAGALNTALEALTGVDILGSLEKYNPTNLYFLTILILFVYAMILLMTIGLVYKFAGINSLSGRASSLKISAFLLCLVGYTVPFLNLLPWFLVWTTVVWKNPK